MTQPVLHEGDKKWACGCSALETIQRRPGPDAETIAGRIDPVKNDGKL